MKLDLQMANLRFDLPRRNSLRLSEVIPCWFAVTSPLIGVLLGLFGAWAVTLLTA